MSEKIVIIGANAFQNKLIKKANSLGFETHVFAWAASDIGEKNASQFYPVDVRDKEQILAKCKELDPVGVCTVGSDLTMLTANYLCHKLGLPANSDESIDLVTNKYATRQLLRDNGFNVPGFYLLNKDNKSIENLDIKLPLIVKPTDRSGSRGVTKLYGIKDLEDAVSNAISYSFSGEAIVEEFIEGEEFSCETISQNGNHTLLAVTKKYTSGSPNYIEKGHVQPGMYNKDLYDKIGETIFKAFDVFGLKNGAFHPEIIIDKNDNIYIVEVGPRMGGDFIGSDLVPLSTGYDYLQMVIDVACGKKINFNQGQHKKYSLVRFSFDEGEHSKLESLATAHIDDFEEKGIINTEKKEDINSSEDRYGYYIFSTDNIDVVNDIMNLGA